jgi:hypothetical protein
MKIRKWVVYLTLLIVDVWLCSLMLWILPQIPYIVIPMLVTGVIIALVFMVNTIIHVDETSYFEIQFGDE